MVPMNGDVKPQRASDEYHPHARRVALWLQFANFTPAVRLLRVQYCAVDFRLKLGVAQWCSLARV